MSFRRLKLSSNRGFTILELMVATSVFAVVLIVLSVGVISFTNDYYKGVTQTKTQTTARAIVNDIAQGIQFGQNIDYSTTPDDNNLNYVCVDNTLYTYKLNTEVIANPDGPHQAKDALMKDINAGNCQGGGTLALDHGRELLADHMRLSALSVVSLARGTYTIHVRVVYGDDDLLTTSRDSEEDTEACLSGSGSQFCATSDLTTTVQSRFASPNQ
jgi:prepilin-type N-terminal cleavage/methylation domain-containing protein